MCQNVIACSVSKWPSSIMNHTEYQTEHNLYIIIACCEEFVINCMSKLLLKYAKIDLLSQ